MTEIAKALIRLSKHKIGLYEASALFALEEGLTVSQLAECLNTSKSIAKSRITPLIRKKLLRQCYRCTQDTVYKPTAKGLAIIHTTNHEQRSN